MRLSILRWPSRVPRALRLCPLLLPLMVGVLACRVDSPRKPNLDERAVEIWKSHERVVSGALEGSWDSDKFLEACLFFEEVAGIQIHVNISSYAGPIPQAGAEDDLRRIREWYQLNSQRLYFDEPAQQVRVRPP